MRVLLTNDDGIGASGLHAARRELRKIEGIQLDVIAPDSNRSATARSITTRSPLSVEEIRFEDGDLGHATDGTPVDCVRFAEVGLLGERPDLIVSGINHGVNLGDDVTYSGTVAAAFEGIVLGIPAISASQQSSNGDLGYRPQREYDFDIAARFLADLVRQVIAEPMPPATLINVNVPGGRPSAVARHVDIDQSRRRHRLGNHLADQVGEEAGGDIEVVLALRPVPEVAVAGLLRGGDRRNAQHDAFEGGRHRARVGHVVAQVNPMIDAGDNQVRALTEQADLGEADAVDRGAVGGVAEIAVLKPNLLDRERRAGGDAACGCAPVGVGRDHVELDALDLAQLAASRV